MWGYSRVLKLTLIENEGYVIENKENALDFILGLDAKGWLDRHEFNRGRNFFLKIHRFDKFKAYCSENRTGIVIVNATTFTTNTYDDHNAHYYAFQNAPLNEKKAWTRIKIKQQQDELNNTTYGSADGYYNAKDNLRRLCAGLQGKTELQYDPMGVWFGRQSN